METIVCKVCGANTEKTLHRQVVCLDEDCRKKWSNYKRKGIPFETEGAVQSSMVGMLNEWIAKHGSRQHG